VGVKCLTSNSHYKNRFFESQPTVGFQKTDFGVSSACGAGNTKIGFIMRIAGALRYPTNTKTQNGYAISCFQNPYRV